MSNIKFSIYLVALIILALSSSVMSATSCTNGCRIGICECSIIDDCNENAGDCVFGVCDGQCQLSTIAIIVIVVIAILVLACCVGCCAQNNPIHHHYYQLRPGQNQTFVVNEMTSVRA